MATLCRDSELTRVNATPKPMNTIPYESFLIAAWVLSKRERNECKSTTGLRGLIESMPHDVKNTGEVAILPTSLQHSTESQTASQTF